MASDDEEDPVVASYDVYIKPHAKDGKTLYIFQFPNRESKRPYSKSNHTLPFELRVKDKSGLIEIDVPVETQRNYDREKGVRWGEAVRRSDKMKGGEGGSHGLPGGFGIGGAAAARPRGAMGDDEFEGIKQEDLARDFASSVEQGRVLAKQTLGGLSIQRDNTTPQYMIGAFRDRQLHLTPVDHIAQLRPQFHHIDALTELERGRARESSSTNQNFTPHAIHMTVKATGDGEEETTDTMAERIRAVQEEPWRRLYYVDEDTEEAWNAYNDNLFVDGVEELPKLQSGISATEYLNTIGAPRAPEKQGKLHKLRTRV